MSETFEVGERVYVDGAYSAPGTIAVVARKTPAGKVEVGGRMYRPDGRIVGQDRFTRGSIRKITPQLEERAQFGAAREAMWRVSKDIEQRMPLVKTAEHAERVKAALQAALDQINTPA